MAKLRLSIFTVIFILIETAIVYFLSGRFNIRLLDSMFYVGVFFILSSFIFSSSGGSLSNLSEAKVMKTLNGAFGGFKHNRTFASISINAFTVGSTIFMIAQIVLASLYY